MRPPSPAPPLHPTLVRIAPCLPGLPAGVGPAYVEGWLYRHRAALTPLLQRSLPHLKLGELFAGQGIGPGLAEWVMGFLYPSDRQSQNG